MGLLIRVLRIGIPLFVGATLLAILFLFAVAYRFVDNSIEVPTDSAPSVAVDLNGRIYFSHSVSYKLYNSDYGLYCTSNTSGKWETVRITDNESVEAMSLAIDADNHLHIAYAFDNDLSTYQPSIMVEGFIGYATNSSGEWKTFIVTHGFGIYRQCWIALAPDGSPGILYVLNGTLMFASVTGDPPNPFVVESLGFDALCGDVAYDKDSVPHVSYVSNQTLLLATRTSPGSWSSSTVYEGQVSSMWTSLVYDRNGSARIAFFSDAGGKGLFYGDVNSGSWNITRVSDLASTEPAFCSMVLDDHEVVHISSSSGTDLAMYSVLNCNRWINYHLMGGDAGPTDISTSPRGSVYLTYASPGGKIGYLTDDASPNDVMSRVPYLYHLGIALVLIAGLFAAIDIVRVIRKNNKSGPETERWPPVDP